MLTGSAVVHKTQLLTLGLIGKGNSTDRLCINFCDNDSALSHHHRAEGSNWPRATTPTIISNDDACNPASAALNVSR